MASYLYGKIKFKSCPFCGGCSLQLEVWANGMPMVKVDEFDKSTSASIECNVCNIKMLAFAEKDHYEHVEGDMYRKLPFKSAIHILAEKWNKRVPVTDEYEV